MFTYVIFVLALFNFKFTSGVSEECVKSKLGTICGVRSTDGVYSMFLGIPYAKVNDSNPFGPSTPYSEFSEQFQANDGSSKCPQLDEFSNQIEGSLDCLKLNIYVPSSINSSSRLPVMVLIHGGAFSIGYGNKVIYGPKFLVRHDVILVTFNYRLGPYGFMCLHTPSVPGNQGLKDQLLALRWIRDNIEEFGGDAESVTVFGESAGARSVDLHLLSPHEKLFHRAILQSGSVLNPGWFPKPNLDAPIKIAVGLGFSTTNNEEAISYLSKVDTDLVIAASRQISDVRFRLCLEKSGNGVDNFITSNPLTAKVAKARNMTIMLGYNSQEMLSTYLDWKPEPSESIHVFLNRLGIAFDLDDQRQIDLEKIIRNFYIGDKGITDNIQFDLADFDSDITYIHPTIRNIQRYLENGSEKMYLYVFSYNGDRNFYKSRHNVTVGGANHGDERGYLFDLDLFSGEISSEDQILIDTMTTMWTNFAKTGNPTPETTDLLPVKWEPITKDSVHHYLNIDLELTTGVAHYHQRMSFWDLIYKNYEEFINIYVNGVHYGSYKIYLPVLFLYKIILS